MQVVLDAGPLVAFLNQRDFNHEWALQHWRRIKPFMLTCEPVITEACFLAQRMPGGPNGVMELLSQGAVQIAFRLQDEIGAVGALMERYANVPMSLADACLVRMLELDTGSTLFTTDSDFRIYRRHGRQVIPTIMPGK